MKARIVWVMVLTLVAIAGGAAVWSGELRASDQTEVQEDVAATARIVTVGADDLPDSRRFIGRIEALRTVDLSFQLSGQMTELVVNEGDVLQNGALIAALDPADFDLTRREARARLELARLEFDRATDLSSRGVASQARREEAVAALELAEVAFDSAERNVRLTRIEAPFRALVARRLIDSFSYVTPQNPVVRVHDVSELRVVISLPEDLVGAVRNPDLFHAEARLAALPGERFDVELREFATEADPVAQTYEVSFVILGESDLRILPGMTATVVIRVDGGAELPPSIPFSAVDSNGHTGFQVWVFDDTRETVAPRPVTLGLPNGDSVPVLEGLARGDRIIASGVQFMRAGAPIRPFNP